MTMLLCSVFPFRLALETGPVKGYRDESVRLQLLSLVHLVGALNLTFLTPFAFAPVIS